MKLLLCFLLIAMQFSGIAKPHPDRIIDSLQKLLLTTRNPEIRLGMLLQLSRATINNHTGAMHYGEEAYALAKKMNDTSALVAALTDRAIMYRNNGNMNKAMQCLLENRTLCERRKDSIGIAETYLEMGLVYRYQDKFKEAEYYMKKANYLARSGTAEQQHDYYSNMATLYMYQGKLSQRTYYTNKSLQIGKKLQDKIRYCKSLNAMASLSHTLGNIKQAEFYWGQAIEASEAVGDKYNRSAIYNNLAGMYAGLQQFDKSLAYSAKAMELSEQAQIKDMVKYSYYRLVDTYKRKGDYKKALFYNERYTQLKDSFYNVESGRQVAEMQTKYETAKKDQENALLAEQNKVNALELSKQRNQLLILSIVIVALCIVAYQFYNRYQLRERLKEMEAAQKIHEERERISKDLHDNVGSQLTYAIIKMHEKANETEDTDAKDLVEVMRNTIGQLRETIWTIKRDEVTIGELSIRIRQYVQQLFKAGSKPECVFQEQLTDASWKLSPMQSLNVFRIIQEALQNIMKHSQAQKVSVRIKSMEDGFLCFWIKDNGKGFQLPNDSGEHYGLQNMRERCEEMGAQFSIQSTLNKGTLVEIKVPCVAYTPVG